MALGGGVVVPGVVLLVVAVGDLAVSIGLGGLASHCGVMPYVARLRASSGASSTPCA